MENETKMLSMKQFAEFLGVHINTMRNYCDKGLVKNIKVDRKVMIPSTEKEKFLNPQ